MSDNDRDAKFLGRLRLLVVGRSAASDSAIAVLRAFGATVERAASVEDHHPGIDAVIVDRVMEGVDADYADQIDARLRLRPEGLGAWVTVSSFGMDGPKSSYRGSEVVAAAAGCMLAAVSDSSGAVHAAPEDQALQTVGQAAALAVLHGLSLSRERGRPVHMDVSAQEAVAFASVQQELAHLLFRCSGQGGTPRYSAIHRVVQCADGLLNVVIVDDHHFARVADVVGRSDWLEKYPTVTERNLHADEINGVIATWAGERSRAQCEEILQANAVPATAFRSVAEAVVSDQFVARGWPYRPGTTTRTSGVMPALVHRRVGPGESPDGLDASHTCEPRSLADMHMVEVTDVLAGPLAGAIVAAMGATVVKVENRERLDTYRRTGPFADGEPGVERAAYFMAANYGKLSVADSLSRDPMLLPRLLSWGDVFLENVGPRRLARLGIDPSVPSEGRGGDCSVSLSGFGRSGPHSHYRAYAWNVHSYAGMADAVARYAGRDFVLRTPLADYCVAMWAATFIAAWWLGNAHEAIEADLSMAEVVAAKLLPSDGHDQDEAASSGVRPSCDLVAPIDGGRFLAVTAADLGRLFSVLGDQEPDPSADARAEALGALTAAAANRGADATVEALQRAGIAAYIAQTPATLLSDDQVRARGFFPEVDHPVLGPSKIIALPWKEAGQSRDWYRRAPLLGEADADVEQILGIVRDGG